MGSIKRFQARSTLTASGGRRISSLRAFRRAGYRERCGNTVAPPAWEMGSRGLGKSTPGGAIFLAGGPNGAVHESRAAVSDGNREFLAG